MHLTRMFSSDNYKGTFNYLNTQKKYEILRTLLYFFISISLYIAGLVTTGNNMNLLTIIAVFGCLPASKSAVHMIMFLRYKSLSLENYDIIKPYEKELDCLYDLVFTSYDKNFPIGHMAVKGNTIIGFTEYAKYDDKAFIRHITQILTTDNHKSVTVKIYTDTKKYIERLEQLTVLDADNVSTAGIISTLKGVSL